MKKLETKSYAFKTDTENNGAAKAAAITQVLLQKQLKEAEAQLKEKMIKTNSLIEVDYTSQPGTSYQEPFNPLNLSDSILVFDGVVNNEEVLQIRSEEQSVVSKQKTKPTTQNIFMSTNGIYYFIINLRNYIIIIQ